MYKSYKFDKTDTTYNTDMIWIFFTSERKRQKLS